MYRAISRPVLDEKICNQSLAPGYHVAYSGQAAHALQETKHWLPQQYCLCTARILKGSLYNFILCGVDCVVSFYWTPEGYNGAHLKGVVLLFYRRLFVSYLLPQPLWLEMGGVGLGSNRLNLIVRSLKTFFCRGWRDRLTSWVFWRCTRTLLGELYRSL